MKYTKLPLALLVIIALAFVSCKETAKEDPTAKDTAKDHIEEHGRPPGPPPHHKEGHKGPPPGGRGGEPIQTKTIEEIGGYNIGDVATDFELKNIDGSMVSLASIENAKGYIVTFTCNECPFAKLYEDRLIALHNTYEPKGYPVIAINPNSINGGKEGYEAMQERAKEKEFPFVYLMDDKQEIYPKYGAVRTPHVFILDAERKIQYIGTIDDNSRSPEDVKVKYVEDAISALEKGEKPTPNLTKAIGCPIKAKQA